MNSARLLHDWDSFHHLQLLSFECLGLALVVRQQLDRPHDNPLSEAEIPKDYSRGVSLAFTGIMSEHDASGQGTGIAILEAACADIGE